MARTSLEPRLLTQGQAASYCGVAVSTFKQACPVEPIKLLDRIALYDRFDLDRWLDSLSSFRAIEAEGGLVQVWRNVGDSGARKGH